MNALAGNLYLDVSEIVIERGNTGIQRVVRRLVQEGQALSSIAGMRIVPVVSAADALHELTPDGWAALATSAPLGGRDSGGEPAPVGSAARLAKRVLRLMPDLYERLRLRRLEERLAGLYVPQPVKPASSDIYAIIDSFWLRSSAPRTATRLRRRGIPSVALIYDAISLTNPEYFTSELTETLRSAVLRMAAGKVAFLSISADAAAALEKALPPLTQGNIPSFRLGHDIPQETAGHVLTWPASLWEEAPVFAMVGTFEPRKNHVLVLDAFEQLWAEGFTGKLMMMGRPGWGVEPLLARLAHHRENGRRLIVLHQVSDAMLADAYDRATATIVASRAEGFGLPLVESLSRGLPVLASDIGVFREIAPSACLFFDPTSSVALAQAVRQMLATLPARREQAQSFAWPNWTEATVDFVSVVQTLADQQRAGC